MELDQNHIVCGRGLRNWNHEGNRIFRQVVESRLADYVDEARGRAFKSRLVDETTQTLLEMGMIFVRRANDNGDWVTLSNRQARIKVAHMFRDASRQARAAAMRNRIRPALG
jgi:hypothetical protein